MIDWGGIEQRISDTRVFYHPDGECTLKVSTLRLLLDLRREVIAIDRDGMLPDGDGVNVSTAMWAEGWAQK